MSHHSTINRANEAKNEKPVNASTIFNLRNILQLKRRETNTPTKTEVLTIGTMLHSNNSRSYISNPFRAIRPIQTIELFKCFGKRANSNPETRVSLNGSHPTV